MCIVCLCVGRKTFFLETKFTNHRETIVIPIADSSPIVGFRGRETYEVSEYTIWNKSICIIRNCKKQRIYDLKKINLYNTKLYKNTESLTESTQQRFIKNGKVT